MSKCNAGDPKLTILSYGIGQDSTAILVMLANDHEFRQKYAPGDLMIVNADTGDEHPETYAYRNYIQGYCRGNGIKFVAITPDMGYHYDNWQSLRGFYRSKNTVGSKAFPKSCTDKLKIQPIYKFLADHVAKKYDLKNNYGKYRGKASLVDFAARYGKIRVLLGIAGDEKNRVAKADGNCPKWMGLAIERAYPLVDLDMDRAACQRTIRLQGLQVPIPSNCMLCPWANDVELLWLSKRYPEDYADWVKLEQNKIDANLHKGDKNLGVWGSTKLLPEILRDAKTKHGHMTDEQLDDYRFSHGHCVMTKY